MNMRAKNESIMQRMKLKGGGGLQGATAEASLHWL
jgi:hypothetical protein